MIEEEDVMATAEVVAVAEAVEEASEVVVAVAVAVPVAAAVETNESPLKTKICKLGGFDQALVLKKGMNEAT